MADSVFNIRISAVDDATKVVNKVNKAVNKIFRPYDNAKKSTKSFFDALGKNDLLSRPLSGFQKLGGAIGSIGSTFGVAESSVLASSARIAAAISSIGGPFGAMVAGGVAAGQPGRLPAVPAPRHRRPAGGHPAAAAAAAAAAVSPAAADPDRRPAAGPGRGVRAPTGPFPAALDG